MQTLSKVLIVVSVAVVGMGMLALVKKPGSVYEDDPNARNPMEGKRVKFVEDPEEPENADGKHGHLEAVGFTDYHPSFYERFVKRILDVVLSFSGLVILSPLFAVLSVWIYIDDPGPVLFTQKRIGKDKQYFKLHKFRSMKMATPHDRPTHMLENPEQYITKSGKFMRFHSLDELPQIWDIWIGNMSVIGPRPALWNQDWLTACRDEYGSSNNIKPGLTGWAQINGRDELEIAKKAELDGVYAKKLREGGFLAFFFDCKCFFDTIYKVIKGDGVVEGIVIMSSTEQAKRRKML